MATARRVVEDGEQLGHALDALGDDEAELGHVSPQAVDRAVRCRTSTSRVRCSTSTDSCSTVLTGTQRIVGRVTASQIASASIASFLPRFT